MKAKEIQEGGRYVAKVSNRLTVVRVLKIEKKWNGLFGTTERVQTVYRVKNERTGRETTFRSPSKFRRPAGKPKTEQPEGKGPEAIKAFLQRVTGYKDPLLEKWEKAKAQFPEALLLIRMGDFAEAFFDDAKTFARVCNLSMTQRRDGTPLCGVPWHAKEAYIKRLVAAGIRVALCEEVKP